MQVGQIIQLTTGEPYKVDRILPQRLETSSLTLIDVLPDNEVENQWMVWSSIRDVSFLTSIDKTDHDYGLSRI